MANLGWNNGNNLVLKAARTYGDDKLFGAANGRTNISAYECSLRHRQLAKSPGPENIRGRSTACSADRAVDQRCAGVFPTPNSSGTMPGEWASWKWSVWRERTKLKQLQASSRALRHQFVVENVHSKDGRVLVKGHKVHAPHILDVNVRRCRCTVALEAVRCL